MKIYRKVIASIDWLIIILITWRLNVSLRIEREKRVLNLPIRNIEVETKKMKNIRGLALKKKINPIFVEKIFREIIMESVRVQEEQRNKNSL